MRILLDQAVYDMRNKGNVALLQVAILRVRNMWPQASLEVMTTAPYLLGLYCPGVIPVDVYGVRNWSVDRKKFERFNRFIPKPLLRILLEVREELEYRKNRRSEQGKNTNSLPDEVETRHASNTDLPVETSENSYSADLEQAIRGADIVIATGGGYLVDSDKGSAIPVLLRLERAKQMGKFTAMVGQGIGVINDPKLMEIAKRVLPTVDLILVREENFAIPLLRSFGVPSEKIHMSGDDAVRLGHETRPTVLGNGIGVGVRLTSYTEVEKKDVERLRPVLHSMAAKHKARLIGLPTTCSGQESDQFIIAELLKGYSNTLNSSFRFESIPDLIRKVGKCRIVITGAFHSAIFAVSQGIPVICLAKSREYSIKFDGLAHQFGKGCQVLHLNDGDFPNKLATIADWLWNEAEHLRPGLLDTAQCQMKMSADGYELIRNAYENR